MKPELHDIATEIVAKPSVGASLAWLSGVDWTYILALVLLVVQIAYTLRKWWREESEWGMRLKRWAAKHGLTSPMNLDD